jgi:type I restriction-modification system DNA methylase subunit
MLQHITSINMLTKKLELSERNADELSARMLKSVHQDDALEQALLTQVETLREQKRKADEDYKELNSKYTAMERDHTSLRKKLSALIG